MVFSILILTFFGIAIAFVVYCRWHRGTLEKLSIPVVKSHYLLGSQHDFHKVVGHYRELEWFQTYGRVYGVYTGRTPQIHILDHDLIRNVFIKDFDKFTNGPSIDFGSAILNEMMDFIEDEKWKTVRSAVTSIFTPSRLKRLSPRIVESVDSFIGLLNRELQESRNGKFHTDLHKEAFTLCMVIVLRCGLNVTLKNPRSPDNKFRKALEELMFYDKPAYLSVIYNLFPFIFKYGGLFQGQTPEQFFAHVSRKVMDQRRASRVENGDLVDLLNKMMDRTKTTEFQALGITDTTVMAQAVEFSVAGVEGMATAVTAVILYASQNPKISEKIYKEVDAYLRRHKGEISFDSTSELRYLSACFKEALRLHPSSPRVDRVCKQDVEYKGLKIPKGMVVALPLFVYNRDPAYFPNPDTFDPERYMLEDHKNPFDIGPRISTFGFGPRQCLGLKFSIACLLVIGVKLFQRFKFTVKSDERIRYFPTNFPVFAYLKPVSVCVSSRSHV